eukprot:jgi/Astpho2/1501/Aster-05384
MQLYRAYDWCVYMQDGFIHLSHRPATLIPIGNNFYRSIANSFVVLKLDPSKLSSEVGSQLDVVKFEPAAPAGHAMPSDAAEVFPHLYGTIDFDAVVAKLPVKRSMNGDFLSVEGL